MIQNIYLGTRISDIAATEFHNGFEDPLLASAQRAGLVLASLDFVPLSASAWFLATHQGGGQGCYTEKAAILPLVLSTDGYQSVQLIAEQRFVGAEGLAEFGIPGGQVDGNESSNRLHVRHQYMAAIAAMGLSCSDALSYRLARALFPVDATTHNLKVLCGQSPKEVAELLDLGRTDICLFIVGRSSC